MEFKLNASYREKSGTATSRRLRKAGRVPAIVYGNSQPSFSITLDHNEIYHALKNEAFHSSVILMALTDKQESVVVRQVQMHPFKQQIHHIDFQRVDLEKAMQIKIALHFVNADISPAVKLQGYRIAHLLNEVEVRALPAKMPTFIEVDLSKISAGDVIRLSDLVLSEGAELVDLLRGDNAIVASTTNKSGTVEVIEESASTETETASEESSETKTGH